MKHWILILFISLIGLTSQVGHCQVTGLTPSNPREWVIDTDVGIDDIIAILYVFNQSSMPVKAITIESDGNAHCQPAYAIIQGILEPLNKTDIPVACGRTNPLRGKHQFPAAVLQAGDDLAKLFPQTAERKPPQGTAKDLLIKILKSAAQPLNILAIGPLTTLAEVIQEHPELKRKIHQITIMGGAIHVPGNIQIVDAKSPNRSAEWNIFIDPYAAEKLFHSGISLTLVPLDSTQQALIDDAFYQDLQKQQNSPAAKFVLALIDQNKQMLKDKVWYFWDPMAAVIANDESIGHFEEIPLSVPQQPEALAGATVVDPKQGAKLRVCMGIDTVKFKKILLAGLNSKNPN